MNYSMISPSFQLFLKLLPLLYLSLLEAYPKQASVELTELITLKKIQSSVILSKNEQQWLKNHPVIRLGSESNWPPYEFINQSGKLYGLTADVIHLVEQRLGIKFKIISQYSWTETVKKLQKGEIDILSSVVKSADRESYLNFTVPYVTPPVVIMIRKQSPYVASLDELKGKTIAIEDQHYLHKRLINEYPEINLLVVETTADALKTLSHGKVDAYIGNQGVAYWVAERQVLTNLQVSHDAGLGEAALRLAVRKDWTILRDIINKALNSISEAELSTIRRQWLGTDTSIQKFVLTATEKQWLDQNPTIRLTGNPNGLPYEAFDKQGHYIGIVADYLTLIEQKLGIKIDIIVSKSWSEAMTKVKQGEVDVLSESNDSLLNLIFTQPYILSPIVIIMKNNQDYVENITQISQKKIAVIDGHSYVSKITKKYPMLHFYRMNNIKDGLTAVSIGKVDALVVTLAQAGYQMTEQGINNIRIVGKTEFTTQLAFGMRPQYSTLVSLFNRALISISQGQKQAIFKRWGKQKYVEKIDYLLLTQLAATFLIIIFIIVYWNRRLVKEVKRRKLIEAQTQALIDNLPLPILVTSFDGRILTANPKILNDYNIPQDKINQFYMNDFYENPNDRKMILQLFADEGKVDQQFVRFKKMNGTVRSMMVSIMPINYNNQKALLTIAVDMTERLEIESALQDAKEQAVQANLSKSEFLANMSHEIRTPMNAIIGFTELLNDQIKEPRLKSFVKTIQSAGNNLLVLINDILDLSKIEAGKFQIEKTACNPHDLFNELGNIFTMKMREKNIDFMLDIDPAIPQSLQLDATRLRQVLFNLIGNAVKFTDHGCICIKAYADNKNEIHSTLDLLISVEDTGIGIAEDQQPHIFKSFEQSSGQDNKKYGGTGLGLSISKKLIEMMGGQITLSSQLGQGSTFTIKLIKVDVASLIVESDNKETDLSHIAFLPSQLLIVDDVADNRALLLANFAETQLQIVEATNGLEAVNLAKQQAFDLILMDIRMPVMDGYQAAQEIKSFSNVPIIALTASVMMDEFERLKSNYFNSYLRKPVLKKDLIQQLCQFLSFEETTITDSEQTKKLTDLEQQHLSVILNQLIEQIDVSLVLAKNNNISEINIFVETLADITKDHFISIVNYYIEQFKEQIDCFDIIAMKASLQDYPQLIEQLKEY